MKFAILLGTTLAVTALSTRAATPIATYRFQNNSFAADEAGKPALTPVDPTGASVFTTDTVIGATHSVWAFNGNATPPAQQAGLTVNTTGLITPQSYSVDMEFEFFNNQNAWRRIIDVQNRQSDNGFYVDPSNNLDVFPVNGSSAAWSNNVYHHIVLTNSGTQVNAYLDGVSQFTSNTAILNLDADPADNPNRFMGFFLDNVAAGGQGEWSSGRVALIRLWDGVLTPQEAQTLASNPFVPEPTTSLLLAAAACGLAGRCRRA